MHEEPESEFAASSGTKPMLVVAGAVVGLMLLICGGAAGYVALAPQPPPTPEPGRPEPNPYFLESSKKQDRAIPFTEEFALVKKIATTIFKIDLPAGFEPIEALKDSTTARAVFGKQTENAALLKMAIVAFQTPGFQGPIASDDPLARSVLKIAENEIGRPDTIMRAVREKTEPKHRELTVLGQKAVLSIRQGKRASDSKPISKAWIAFLTKNGVAALIFVVPDAEFDEEAIVRMIESIRPPDDDEPDAEEK
jgi:hypothetical protein